MKVAIVYTAFPHYREAIISALSRKSELSPTFVAAHVASWNGIKTTANWTKLEHANLRLFKIGPFEIHRGLLSFLLSQWRTTEAVVFLGNPYYPVVWLAGLLCRFGGKRVLFWTHGWLQNGHDVKSRIRDIFFRIPHGLLLYGARARAIGISRGFDANKLFVIWNSLNYESQRQFRVRLERNTRRAVKQRLLDTAKSVIICTGRIMTNCRFDLLLEAEAILRKRGILCKIVLIGDGPIRPMLEITAKQLGTDIVFVGETYDEETIASLVYAADITVCPGKIGLSAMHSLAYGTPVISHSDADHQMPEVESILPGRTGLLFQKDNFIDLADKIEVMIDMLAADDSHIRSNCIRMIEERYNAENQARLIAGALVRKGE